jgi:hypothetical protein
MRSPFVALKGFLKIKVVIPRLGLKSLFCVNGVYHVKLKLYLPSRRFKIPVQIFTTEVAVKSFLPAKSQSFFAAFTKRFLTLLDPSGPA